MKPISLLLLLALSACSTMQNYKPTLSENPKNMAKYEADLRSCRAEASDREERAAAGYNSGGRWLLPGLFGVAGSAADAASSQNDSYKLPATLIDECLVSKGYKPV